MIRLEAERIHEVGVRSLEYKIKDWFPNSDFPVTLNQVPSTDVSILENTEVIPSEARLFITISMSAILL